MRFGVYKINCDRQATINTYKNVKKYGCNCSECRNYLTAIETFPREVKDFFDKLGINIYLASEIYSYDLSDKDGSVLYGGWYHFVGENIGNDFWTKTSPGSYSREKDSDYKITDNFSVYFTSRTDLVHLVDKAFNGKNVVQMDISFNVPWILSETLEKPVV